MPSLDAVNVLAKEGYLEKFLKDKEMRR